MKYCRSKIKMGLATITKAFAIGAMMSLLISCDKSPSVFRAIQHLQVQARRLESKSAFLFDSTILKDSVEDPYRPDIADKWIDALHIEWGGDRVSEAQHFRDPWGNQVRIFPEIVYPPGNPKIIILEMISCGPNERWEGGLQDDLTININLVSPY